uniref:Uncharacterized protein n=1 Tax=Timema poppense TaxID=170557 RepID=A0A7R9DV27_TIMPO|nr:unnamed protein product [Timema poppensis]
MIGGDIQPEDPNSLEQLLQFNENGICSADGDWSMGYWDPYGFDEGLLEHIAMEVAPLRVGATHDGIAGLPQDPATRTTPPGILAGPPLDMATPTIPPGILSPVPLSSAPPSVWSDLDTLDRLLFELEAGNGGTTIATPPPAVGCLQPIVATSPQLHEDRVRAPVPPPVVTASTLPLHQRDGVRALAAAREMGPMEPAIAGPYSAPQPGFSGSVNQVGGALSDGIPLRVVEESIKQ